MKVVTAGVMQSLDRETIRTLGIPGVVLMENAGKGCAAAILKHFPDLDGKIVSVLCGSGNNGGDGYVIARYLRQRGIQARVYLLAAEERIRGDARIHLDILRRILPEVYPMAGEEPFLRHRGDILHSGLLVDAILGTGLASEVEGYYRRVIEWVNRTGIPVCAVDIPSGIHADTGRVMGCAINARLTVTFGMAKRGQFVHPGVDHVGVLEVVDIGIPKSLVDSFELKEEVLEPALFRGALARRPDTHKGTYGHLFVLAGSPGKTGAACLCAEAALRAGAGLVTLGIGESVHSVVAQKVTEVMTMPLPEKGRCLEPREALERIEGFLHAAKAVAVGPGLGLDRALEGLVEKLWTTVALPSVWDADALTLLARCRHLEGKQAGPTILTPHPGEMARLLDKPTSWVQQNRIEAARSLAEQWNGVVVLKGARTLIADPSGRLAINPTGNPGMAAGGMGDVLTGVIGGILAQGLSCFEAACLGAFVHGAAGDAAAREIGPVGFLATELMSRVPKTLGRLSIT